MNLFIMQSANCFDKKRVQDGKRIFPALTESLESQYNTFLKTLWIFNYNWFPSFDWFLLIFTDLTDSLPFTSVKILIFYFVLAMSQLMKDLMQVFRYHYFTLWCIYWL